MLTMYANSLSIYLMCFSVLLLAGCELSPSPPSLSVEYNSSSMCLNGTAKHKIGYSKRSPNGDKLKKETMQTVLSISVDKMKDVEDIDDPTTELQRFVLIKNTVQVLRVEIQRQKARAARNRNRLYRENCGYGCGPLSTTGSLLFY